MKDVFMTSENAQRVGITLDTAQTCKSIGGSERGIPRLQGVGGRESAALCISKIKLKVI